MEPNQAAIANCLAAADG